MNILRPTQFSDIVGNESAIGQIAIAIKAAQKQNRVLGHILLSGPPGTGKSTICAAISHELGRPLETANGGNLTSLKAILPALSRTSERSLLFIDEIHRMRIKVSEFLYPVMEDFRMDIGNDDISIDLQPFTMIGATTEAGSLPPPLYDRFIYKIQLSLYTIEELVKIIQWSVKKLQLTIPENCAIMIAQVSRGTPRVANNYVRWIADYAIAHGQPLSAKLISDALGYIGVDSEGMTNDDRLYLDTLRKLGVASLKTMESTTGISKQTLEEVIEPYLLRKQMIKKTSKGRKLI